MKDPSPFLLFTPHLGADRVTGEHRLHEARFHALEARGVVVGDGAKQRMRRHAIAAVALAGITMAAVPPAAAQFYKDKTLTLLINYAPGGNSDLEARVFQSHLKRFIPGNPTVIIANQPGAGGTSTVVT